MTVPENNPTGKHLDALAEACLLLARSPRAEHLGITAADIFSRARKYAETHELRNPEAYARTVLRHLAADRHRSRAAERVRIEKAARRTSPPVTRALNDEVVVHLTSVLSIALLALRQEDRDLVARVYARNESISCIAVQLARDESVIRRRLHRAIFVLRIEIDRLAADDPIVAIYLQSQGLDAPAGRPAATTTGRRPAADGTRASRPTRPPSQGKST